MFKLISFIPHKNRLKKHEQVCNDHDYCHVEMPDKYNKTLEYNHGEKSLKVPFIIYVDLECLLETIGPCLNNPEKSYTHWKAKHEPSGWAMTGTMAGQWMVIWCNKKQTWLLQRKRLY